MTAEKKATLKIALIAALFFTLIFGIIETLISGLTYALIVAPLAGILFAVFIYLFINSKIVSNSTSLPESGNSIYSGAANHFKNLEAVGGRLYLFTDRLEFKSHGFNIQNHAFAIGIEEIKEIRFYKTLGLVPNGLQIDLTDGESERFVVSNRNIWKTEIQKRIHATLKK